jgi:hypothetical protein
MLLRDMLLQAVRCCVIGCSRFPSCHRVDGCAVRASVAIALSAVSSPSSVGECDGGSWPSPLRISFDALWQVLVVAVPRVSRSRACSFLRTLSPTSASTCAAAVLAQCQICDGQPCRHAPGSAVDAYDRVCVRGHTRVAR